MRLQTLHSQTCGIRLDGDAALFVQLDNLDGGRRCAGRRRCRRRCRWPSTAPISRSRCLRTSVGVNVDRHRRRSIRRLGRCALAGRRSALAGTSAGSGCRCACPESSCRLPVSRGWERWPRRHAGSSSGWSRAEVVRRTWPCRRVLEVGEPAGQPVGDLLAVQSVLGAVEAQHVRDVAALSAAGVMPSRARSRAAWPSVSGAACSAGSRIINVRAPTTPGMVRSRTRRLRRVIGIGSTNRSPWRDELLEVPERLRVPLAADLVQHVHQAGLACGPRGRWSG